MESFKMKAVADWHGVLPGEKLAFETEGHRVVQLSIIANGAVEVWATWGHDTPWKKDAEPRDLLVGQGQGQFDVEFSTVENTLVQFLADEDVAIFVRGYAPDMRVAESDEPSFVEIAPRQRRNTELDRMMMWVKLNEQRREEQYRRDLEAMETRLAAQGKPQDQAQPQDQAKPDDQAKPESEGAADA